MIRLAEPTLVNISSFLDTPEIGDFAPTCTSFSVAANNDLEGWNRRAECIDLIWRSIHSQLDVSKIEPKMQRTSRTSFARRFVKKRCLSVPLYKIHYKKTERNDVPKTNKSTIASLYRTLNCTTSACASPADIELCQQPLIPLQKFIFTLQIPTLGDPLYLSGHQTLDGKIILSEKQTTMLQEQWDVEIVGGCRGGRPGLYLHISNGETGATMSLPLTEPDEPYGDDRRLACLSSNGDFITKCFSSWDGGPYFSSSTGLCFGFEHDLQKVMVKHPLAQILLGCKIHAPYDWGHGMQNVEEGKLMAMLNIAGVIEDENTHYTRGDEGLILSGYLDFSTSDKAHFKINLTRHYRNIHHSYNDFIEDEWSFDIMNDLVLSTVLNCVKEMH